MLTVTDNAITEIRAITEQPQAPVGGGLRISAEPDRSALTLTLAAAPAADDAVIDEGGARVFLDQTAAALLDDKTLDTTTDSGGQVQFAVAPQPV